MEENRYTVGTMEEEWGEGGSTVFDIYSNRRL